MIKIILKAVCTLFFMSILVFVLPSLANAGPPPGGYLDELKYPNIVPPDSEFGTHGFEIGKLNDPIGIDIDSEELIYITDSSNNRVQVFNMKGVPIHTWGSAGSNESEFISPMGIAISPGNEYVYVSDSGNHRIQVFDKTGTVQGQWGNFGSDKGEFKDPVGLAVDSNNVYVADSGNNRVEVFDLNGKFILSFGQYGDEMGEFNNPRSVTVDEQGNIYVADTFSNRIQKFDSTGKFLKTWGTYGSNNGNLVVLQKRKEVIS